MPSQNNRPTCAYSPDDCCELSQVPSKGFGLIATKHIPRGSTILDEPPLLVFPSDPTADKMKQLYAALSPSNRKVFASFQPSGKYVDLLVDIAKINGIPLRSNGGEQVLGGSRPRPGKMGVFEWASRVNHSCVPNAVWRWDETEEKLSESRFLRSARSAELSGRARWSWWLTIMLLYVQYYQPGGTLHKAPRSRLRTLTRRTTALWRRTANGTPSCGHVSPSPACARPASSLPKRGRHRT